MAGVGPQKVLELRHLAKRYGKTVALDDLSLTVYQGEVFGLLGPNGAGKTTAIRAILGLIRPDAGEVAVMGRPVMHQPEEVMCLVGAIVEGPAAYGYMTGRDNLRHAAMLAGDGAEQRIDSVMALVGLADKSNVKVKGYSLGMKARLALAQALIGDPRLLILDEPTNGLDPRGIRDVRRLIVHLAQERGVTVLLSSHLLHEVQQTCGRVAITDKGRLVVTGAVGELLTEQAARDLEELFIELTGGEDADLQ